MLTLDGLLWQSVHAKFNENPSIGVNIVRRKIFGPKWDEVTKDWRRLRKDDKVN
jgi:hypothetical protein